MIGEAFKDSAEGTREDRLAEVTSAVARAAGLCGSAYNVAALRPFRSAGAAIYRVETAQCTPAASNKRTGRRPETSHRGEGG